MDTKATAILVGGSKVDGRLTTAHSASSYGQPVFVGDDGTAYNWIEIVDISTAAELGRRGGAVTGGAKADASRENGKRGGRKMSKVTARAIELWKALPDYKLGEFPHTYEIRMTLTAEFPDESSARISNCAMQAVRMLKRAAKK